MGKKGSFVKEQVKNSPGEGVGDKGGEGWGRRKRSGGEGRGRFVEMKEKRAKEIED